VRDALSVPAKVPVVIVDARNRVSVADVLLALVRFAVDIAPE
jgi:uncharacterized protein